MRLTTSVILLTLNVSCMSMPPPPKGQICSLWIRYNDDGTIKEYDEFGKIKSVGICSLLVKQKPKNESELIEALKKIQSYNEYITINENNTYNIPLGQMHKYIAIDAGSWFNIVEYLNKLKHKLKKLINKSNTCF